METINYLYYFGVLAVLIVGILAIVYILKRFTRGKARTSAQSSDIFSGKTNSLFIQEVLPVDQKTKIIIIGRDNMRHVILLGENHASLIETVAPQTSQNQQTPQNSQTESRVQSIKLASPHPETTSNEQNAITDPNTTEPNKTQAEMAATAPTQNPAALETNIAPEPDTKEPATKKSISNITEADLRELIKNEKQDIKNKLQNAKDLSDSAKD